jgi:hypothetical protein
MQGNVNKNYAAFAAMQLFHKKGLLNITVKIWLTLDLDISGERTHGNPARALLPQLFSTWIGRYIYPDLFTLLYTLVEIITEKSTIR